MKKTTKGAIGLFGAFVLGCTSAPLMVPALSAQGAPPGVTRWQYTCYRDQGSINTDQLNEYGAQGWELVGPRDPGGVYCFKRPR